MNMLRRPIIEPEDFLRMEGTEGFELVDGTLQESGVGAEASWIAGFLFELLAPVVRAGRLGYIFPPDTMYRCYPSSQRTVRKPDLSFIRRERMPGNQLPKGFLEFPPDLVVEVTSPNETVAELDDKLQDHFKAGVPHIWVINPETRSVHVYAAGGAQARRLTGDDELTGDPIVPGFRIKVCDLFEFPPVIGPDPA